MSITKKKAKKEGMFGTMEQTGTSDLRDHTDRCS
jgi:hypothetical protein